MTTSDRLEAAIRKVLNAELDRLLYFMVWEYTVSTVTPGQPVVCQLISLDLRMPDCVVNIRPGPDGSTSTPPEGASVLVMFVAGDPSKPWICSTDPENPPTTVTIAGGGPKAARTADEITISVAQFTAAGPVADLTTGAVVISSDMKGSITGGSAKTEIG